MMALSRMPEECRSNCGMWFSLFLPDTCGTTEGPPEEVRAVWRSGQIRPFW